MKIAIPSFGEEIAPWFDVASHLMIYDIGRDRPVLLEVYTFDNEPDLDRARRVRDAASNVLICGGIGNKAKSMLHSLGITIINDVTGSVEAALKSFYSGELCGMDNEPIYRAPVAPGSLRELIEKAKRLFENEGYELVAVADPLQLPIDLLAQKNCSGCGRAMRVAICCGLHAYRVDEEIRAFHQAASGFDRRIYINAPHPEIEKACADYGIQLLDPEAKKLPTDIIAHPNCAEHAVNSEVRP